MKQFVGLYAVGDEGNNILSTVGGQTVPTPVYIRQLAASGEMPFDARFMPLGMMGKLKPGLYAGIVTVTAGVEVKVLPMKLENNDIFEELISGELRQQCLASLDFLFGAAGAEEPASAYVNQDQS